MLAYLILKAFWTNGKNTRSPSLQKYNGATVVTFWLNLVIKILRTTWITNFSFKFGREITYIEITKDLTYTSILYTVLYSKMYCISSPKIWIDSIWAWFSIIEHYWALLSIIEHYWALLSIIEHYWALLSIIEHYWALLSIIEHYWALLSIIEHISRI